MKALFLCGKGRIRSPAAAEIALEWPGVASDFAGLGADADERLTQGQLDWATRIFVMERRHRARLARLPGLDASGRRTVCLDVPDRFSPGDPALHDLLRARLARHLA